HDGNFAKPKILSQAARLCSLCSVIAFLSNGTTQRHWRSTKKLSNWRSRSTALIGGWADSMKPITRFSKPLTRLKNYAWSTVKILRNWCRDMSRFGGRSNGMVREDTGRTG